jgi:hypothetical protein
MIVEIFGPPAVGKTRLAHALAAGLRERGLGVELALSYRPSEVARSGGTRRARRLDVADTARRLSRPAIETLAGARRLFGDSPEARLARAMLELMPPTSAMWSVRLRQYIWRLGSAWNAARASSGIVIFDQGFVQAVCSLGLLGSPAHANRLPLALNLAPRADFLIRVDASRDVLRARLLKRASRQGVLERLLELDLDTNLRSISIIEDLQQLLEERGAPVASVASADEASLGIALTRLERMAAAGSVRAVAASA